MSFTNSAAVGRHTPTTALYAHRDKERWEMLVLLVSGSAAPLECCTPPAAPFPLVLSSILAGQLWEFCAALRLPWAGFFATGGGTLSHFTPPFEKAAAFDLSDTCMSSAARLCFRPAWASGEEAAAVSMTTFFVLLEKMKLAVEAGDLCMSHPSCGFKDWAPGSLAQLTWESTDGGLWIVTLPVTLSNGSI